MNIFSKNLKFIRILAAISVCFFLYSLSGWGAIIRIHNLTDEWHGGSFYFTFSKLSNQISNQQIPPKTSKNIDIPHPKISSPLSSKMVHLTIGYIIMECGKIISLFDQACPYNDESNTATTSDFTIWIYPGEHYHITKLSLDGSFREGLFDATDSYPPPKYIN